MKIALLIAISILCFGFYTFKKPGVDKYLSKVRLQKKFANYPQLGIDSIRSAHFELIKINEMNGDNLSNEVLYFPDSKTFIFIHKSLSFYWKIDENGNLLGSLADDVNLHACGVFFHDSYYIDWPLTGDGTKKPYKDYIKATSLSKEQLGNYVSRADVVAYQTRYLRNPDQWYGRCLLEIQGDWVVIERELNIEEDGFDFSEDPQKHTMQGYATKNDSAYNLIDNTIAHFFKSKKTVSPITIEAHVKTKRVKKPFFSYDINNSMRKNGWEGRGYFHWKMEQDTIKFQAYSYEVTERHLGGYDPSMRVYRVDSLPQLAFLVVEASRGNRPSEEMGLHVMRKIEN